MSFHGAVRAPAPDFIDEGENPSMFRALFQRLNSKISNYIGAARAYFKASLRSVKVASRRLFSEFQLFYPARPGIGFYVATISNKFHIFSLLMAVGCVILALMYGFLFPQMQPALAERLVLLEIFIICVWFFPELALLVPLLCSLEGIPEITVKMACGITIILFAYVLARRHSDIKTAYATHRRQFLSIGIMLMVAMMSSFCGYFYWHNFKGYVFTESQIFVYWLLFPASAILVVSERSTKILYWSLICFGVLFAIIAMVLSVTGWNFSFSEDARREVLDSASGGIAGIRRSIVPGVQLTLFAFYNAVAAIIRDERRRWLWICVGLICLAGIFVNFGRALWVVAFVSVVFMAAISGRRALRNFAVYGGLFILVSVTAVYIFKPTVLQAVADRIGSVSREGGLNSSLGWRFIEDEYALPKIAAHPFFGIGLGGEYKPRLVALEAFTEQTRYIHNAYLGILLKMGVVGLFFILGNFILLMLSVIRPSRLRESGRSPQLALAAILISSLILSVTQPELFSRTTYAIVGVLTPVVLRLRFSNRESTPRSRVPPSKFYTDGHGPRSWLTAPALFRFDAESACLYQLPEELPNEL